MRKRNGGFRYSGALECPLCDEHEILVHVHHMEDYYGPTYESSEQGFTDIEWDESEVTCRTDATGRCTLTREDRRKIDDAAFEYGRSARDDDYYPDPEPDQYDCRDEYPY